MLISLASVLSWAGNWAKEGVEGSAWVALAKELPAQGNGEWMYMTSSSG